MLEVEGLYCPFSENKGADKLCGYSATDLCLCFCIYVRSRFSHDAAHTISFVRRLDLKLFVYRQDINQRAQLQRLVRGLITII